MAFTIDGRGFGTVDVVDHGLRPYLIPISQFDIVTGGQSTIERCIAVENTTDIVGELFQPAVR